MDKTKLMMGLGVAALIAVILAMIVAFRSGDNAVAALCALMVGVIGILMGGLTVRRNRRK